MKRIIALTLSVVLCFTMILTSCSQQQAEKKTDAAKTEATKAVDSNLTAKGTYPIVNNPVTLKIMINPLDWVGDLDTNKTTKWYESKTNVKINWQRTSETDFPQKMNLILASNSDLPDIFFHRNTFAADFIYNYGTEGMFIPLNGLIDKWGVGIKKIFEYDSTFENKIKAPDGNIYALPRYQETYHMQYGQKAWINQKWLDKLNMKMPETTEDFYQVLKAFKEKDPNGNGKADEIPLAQINPVYEFFMNPFTFSPSTSILYLKDKKVEAVVSQPKYKDGIKFLNKLYTEGLLDKEFLTNKPAQVKQLAENPEGNRLGVVTHLAISGFTDLSKDRKLEYTALPPLKGSDGTRQTPYMPTAPRFNVVITKASKYPDVAFRWADGFYDSYNEQGWRGEENVDWRKAKPNEIGLDGKPATFIALIPYGSNQNSFWEEMAPFGPGFQTQQMRNGYKVVTPGVWEQEKVLIDESKNKYEPYKSKNYEVLPPLFINKKDMTDYLQIKETLNTIVTDYTARFITGAANINNDWDKYMTEIKQAELDKFIKLTQDAYNVQYGAKK